MFKTESQFSRNFFIIWRFSTVRYSLKGSNLQKLGNNTKTKWLWAVREKGLRFEHFSSKIRYIEINLLLKLCITVCLKLSSCLDASPTTTRSSSCTKPTSIDLVLTLWNVQNRTTSEQPICDILYSATGRYRISTMLPSHKFRLP